MLCKKPIYLSTTGGYVPCGRCLKCRINRRQKKTSRCALECHDAVQTLFVTATYNDKWLPTEYVHKYSDGRTKFFSSLTGTLNRRHCQLFIKRLRDAVSPVKFRVFYVGEYGDKNMRPHYHFIFFNYPLDQTWRMYESWHDEKSDEPMCAWERFTIETPRSPWDVSQYTSRYTVKKMTSDIDPRLGGAFPEFFASSKGLGLSMVPSIITALDNPSGWSYIYENGDIPRTIKLMGKNLSIDRYMKEKILDALEISTPGIKEKIKAIRFQKYQEQMRDLSSRAVENKTTAFQILAEENAQPLKNLERQFEIFNSKKGKL